MTYFRDALLLANDEGYSVTDEGLASLYEVFEHFAKGGSILDHPEKSPNELQILMAVTWKDVRDYALLREKYGKKSDGDS